MKSPFYAYLSRLKHIQRWSLMRNSDPENVMEHSWMVAVIAHGLAILHNQNLKDDSEKVDDKNIAIKALYHDITEVLTGDLPTPIKYHSEQMKQAFSEIEDVAAKRLLRHIPDDQREAFQQWVLPPQDHEDDTEEQIVKAADKISAWMKCIEERRAGNLEFSHAEESTKKEIDASPLLCVKLWLDHYASTFECSLDELEWLEKDRENEAENNKSSL